jgi:anaphase-promoting complex subunit 2
MKVIFHLNVDDTEALLQIFPSKNSFAKEYHQILSEQLINMTNYEAESQIRHVEILTGKFGESLMSQAKVMLKDLADSRRLFNTHNPHQSFSALVISHLFWPKLPVTKFIPPEFVRQYIDLTRQMDAYVKTYEDSKTSRKLEWMSEHGLVELIIAKQDGSKLELQVSPVEAAVVLLFEKECEMSLHLVAEQIGTSLDRAKQAVDFWKAHEVLQLFDELVVSLDDIDSERLRQLSTQKTTEISTESIQCKQHLQEHVQTIWPMIQGMLTNLGALDKEMIHRTLGMFASDAFQYSLTVQELEEFLEFLVTEDKLDVDENRYKIKRE